MSQWNNTFAHNNHYQDGNTWSSDHNAQYMRQGYYPNRQYDQYVSFDEFLSQVPGNGINPSTNYNTQFQSYPNGQYSLPTSNAHNSSQLNSDNYRQNGSNVDNHNQYSSSSSNLNTHTNEVLLRSNLTPTATEFIPKSSIVKPSSQSLSMPESNNQNGTLENRSKRGSSSDYNWRDKSQVVERAHKSFYNSQSNSHETQSSPRETEELYDSYDPRDTSNNHSEAKVYGNQRNGQNCSNNSRNQSKNNKAKIKESDVARTFYNSAANKGTQDVRVGRGDGLGRQRTSIGSHRIKMGHRNNVDDEQYAKSYMQQRNEKYIERDRVKPESVGSSSRNRNKHGQDLGNKELTQRERLSEQLDAGILECLVCCERVKQMDSVWSCGNCYHVFHLRCIRKWATSSIVEGKWRCPACQNTSEEVPTEYRCMCGAVRSPEYQRGSTGAHTCGKSCKRPRDCPHPCSLLCHPGPCPPCQATVKKQCGCGAETRSVLCSSKLPQLCGRVCNRTLDCGVHKCTQNCHEGFCEPCMETVTQVCYCPAAKSRSVSCTIESGSVRQWSCGTSCARVLACGAHVCRAPCHTPPCQPCRLLPDLVYTCPCGKTKLEKGKRKTCTDPIPLCGSICAKPLSCGPAGDMHFCKLDCHEGPCPVCSDKTLLQCRCGHSSREVPCSDLPEMLNNVFCQKKCNKKLSCGRHRCRAVCCAAQSHRCAVVCGRTLSCQLHRCEEFCHTGHCAPCPRLSFEELSCECGAQVLYPPVRCGARPPACSAECRRERPCGHPPHHSCHSGDCPPCVVLTAKMCHGGHEERKTIPCSQEEFSCGLPCGKPLPCGKHNCTKTCHKGSCDTGKCTQACLEKRHSCGHECAAPCHVEAEGGPTPCPSIAPCRRPVRATCPCGRRSTERPCCDNFRDYAKIMSALAATKIQEGGSVDLSEMQRPSFVLKTLECDEECRKETRNRQLALALQIRNPDVSAKLAPRYSEHVRGIATKEPGFAHQIHDRLTELVQLAKKSKQKTRSHSFPSMNWQKRQFIHELAEQFGCESVAYDAEPNRNVVVTADKERSWLPAMSVLEVLAREAGKRRVPGPMLRSAVTTTSVGAFAATNNSASKSTGGWATLTSTNAWAARSQTKPQTTSETKIDYFDNPPDN